MVCCNHAVEWIKPQETSTISSRRVANTERRPEFWRVKSQTVGGGVGISGERLLRVTYGYSLAGYINCERRLPVVVMSP